ncbi:MAG TPA: NAD-dependent epimerase/dehydratase family protein [Vicinamibacterales bacterium]|nr:NAD-dependent epimerase/dehydratase family protein [Vicinamibacterales bacterium]
MDALKLQGARALVTGGAGLIGSHIVDGLIAESAAEVVVLDNFSRGRREHLDRAAATGRVRIVDGDICDAKLVAELMQGIDVLFHQAAIRITQCAEEPGLAIQVLVNGTYTVVEAAVGAGVRKVVAASSASIYGMADEFPTSEDHHPYNNRTIYGAGKLFNEGLLRSFNEQYGLNYVALRYFNVFGPRMDTHGAYTEVFIRWMEQIEQGKPPVIFGDGTQTMDFIYVGDIARANLLAATSTATDRVYNIATGVEVSLKECAERLLHVMGSPLSPEYAPARRVNPVPRRIADTRAAQQDLGFQSRVSFDDGLRLVVDWWRTQRKGAAYV